MPSLLHKFSTFRPRRPAVDAQPLEKQDPIYRPLDASQDSIRLVFIHPADDPEAPIRCIVSEAKFRERPQYEALSYMWGDEAVRRPIIINDQLLEVTQNLFDALHFLRLRQRASNSSGGFPALRYWIDAICINQNDVHEKNKQIRIMPHIYFRARTVLVWLGKKEHEEVNSPQGSEKFQLYKAIYHDEYWTRLWIVQEIGKATQLRVCYVIGSRITASSSYSLEWNRLIQDVEAHYTGLVGGGNEGPIRLDRQLWGKYSGSHSLLTLIETHRDARCKNPRDKIFGLVGLATDSASDFPIDYQKSLFEVWKDTLSYLQVAGRIGKGDLVGVAQLVLECLGGPTQVLLNDVSAKVSLSSAVGFTTSFNLRLTVLGVVMFVGPPPGNVINSLEQADLWTKTIQRGIESDRKGSLLQENDGLLQSLLTMGDLDLPSLGIGPSPVRDSRRYACRQADGFAIRGLQANPFYLGSNPFAKQVSSKMKQKSKEEGLPQRCWLYRLKMTGPSDDGCNLGLATDVRPRDLLCRIPQTGKTFLLRSKDGSDPLYMRIAGTALVAQELFPPERRVRLRTSWDLTLYIDAETLYKLLT
ncbi:hypothetical protein MFIFM68171_04684 [Madurella fahalii]|uniref:Heterokaryon incompatibility domain-containing protein n=1 Tax=Madurella fahalii TaxID=1157608 RepID=A0ABQ0G9Y3_9PEZI